MPLLSMGGQSARNAVKKGGSAEIIRKKQTNKGRYIKREKRPVYA